MSDEKFVITGPPDVEIPPNLSFSEHVLNSLRSGGNEIAQVDGVTGKFITYSEILQKSINLAHSLQRLGLGKGDVVCISSENRFEFTITAYAVFYIGGVVSTLNISYENDEMRHALSLSKPRIIFCSALTARKVKNIAESNDNIEQIVLYGDDPVIKSTLFSSLISEDEDITGFRPADVDPVKDHLVILCSSGTTGLPKGVMLTHRNFLLCKEHLRSNMLVSGRSPGNVTIFSIIPWFHAYGFVTHTIFVTLHYKFVFAFKFEDDLFLRIIQNEKANIVFAVPPLVLFLAKHPMVTKYNLSSLEELWCGAAPLSKELQETVIKRLNLRVLKQGYGMTETTLATLIDLSNGTKPGTAGTVTWGTKAKLVDLTTGEALGPYKEGELCFKGPLMMKGYVGNAAATEHIFDKDGWLHTGDVAYYDEDKYFYIIDRLKELIKYKAFQVPPAELEALLLQHPAIKDVGVVGLPDEAVGEKPLAFVVKQPNAKITEADIIKYVASKVSSAKHLRGGVRFLSEIPKNPSGKILRRELRNILKREVTSKL